MLHLVAKEGFKFMTVEFAARFKNYAEGSTRKGKPAHLSLVQFEWIQIQVSLSPWSAIQQVTNSTAFLQNRLFAFSLRGLMPHIFDALYTPESLAQFVQETGDLIKNASVCQLTPYFAEVWNWSQVSLSLLCKHY